MDIQRHMSISGYSNITETMNVLVSEIAGLSTEFSVLDLGCGYGLYGYLLRSYFHDKVHLVGVDVKAPRKGWRTVLEVIYNQWVKEDIREFQLTQKYDIIMALHVLEHLEKQQAFDLISRLMKKTNYLLIGLPRGKKGFIYRDQESPDTHKWAYDPKDFKQFKLLPTKSLLLEWRRYAKV